MKDTFKTHHEAQTAINALNEHLNLELHKGTGIEGIKDAVKKFCFTCMQPANPDCDICNWHIRRQTNDDLFWGFTNIPHRE